MQMLKTFYLCRVASSIFVLDLDLIQGKTRFSSISLGNSDISNCNLSFVSVVRYQSEKSLLGVAYSWPLENPKLHQHLGLHLAEKCFLSEMPHWMTLGDILLRYRRPKVLFNRKLISIPDQMKLLGALQYLETCGPQSPSRSPLQKNPHRVPTRKTIARAMNWRNIVAVVMQESSSSSPVQRWPSSSASRRSVDS